jgi:hypothetical protein
MLSSNMLVPILIPLIDVTFSTPTRYYTHLSFTDGCTGCDPNRKQSKFE